MQCGALSGLVAQSITYPIEVTRRRMQTLGLVGEDTALSNLGTARDPSSAIHRPPSMMSIVRDLYQEQGVRGFFKGVSMNWLKGKS
jgi:Mitochondrial carrier protein